MTDIAKDTDSAAAQAAVETNPDLLSPELYTLCNIKTGQFVLRAYLLECQDWVRFIDGPLKTRLAKKDPTVKRLGAMTPEQQESFYRALTGKEPNSDYDVVLAELQGLAEAVPVDETSIGQLREMIIEKWGAGAFTQKQPTENKEKTMSDQETATQATPTTTTKPAKAPRPAGAKALVRQIYAEDPNASLSVEELAAKTGKPASSITTAISDLKSSKYCKPGDPVKLYRSKDGKYSLTQPVEEAAPAQGQAPAADQAPATQPADALPAV